MFVDAKILTFCHYLRNAGIVTSPRIFSRKSHSLGLTLILRSMFLPRWEAVGSAQGVKVATIATRTYVMGPREQVKIMFSAYASQAKQPRSRRSIQYFNYSWNTHGACTDIKMSYDKAL